MATEARRPLIAGNWKMNLNHLEAIALVQKLAFTLDHKDFERAEIIVIPPFTDIRSVQTLIDGDRLDLGYGAQDLSPHTDGAYTGDISGSMLAKLGCSYVLVGHSERRQGHGEGDDVVNAKVKAAYAAGLTPIVCVGEELAIRQAGDHVGHCQKQLVEALAGISAEQAASVVLAYEPIWAIGTGEVALPEHAQEVAAELRTHFAGLYGDTLAAGVRIIYGGSVKAANAAGLLDQPDVDGALVGGASLQAEEFAGIARWQSA